MNMVEKDGLKLISKYRTAIMGFAALWILYFHEGLMVFEKVPVIGKIELFLKSTGFCGVDIFLFLSGMGLTYAIQKSSLPMFYYKRIKRLIIPFLFMAILRACLEHWNTQTFFLNFFGVNFYIKSIYSYLWFIPAILTLYLFFPLYYFFFSKAKSKLVFTTGVIGVWFILTLIFATIIRPDMFGFTNRIPIFVIGILIGYYQQHKSFEFTIGTYLVLLIFLGIGIYLSVKTNMEKMPLLIPSANNCLPNCLITISSSCLFAKFFDILSNKVKVLAKILLGFLGIFGMISLEFYCVQEFVGGKLMPLLFNKFSNFATNMIILAAVTVSAFVLYFISKYIFIGIERLFKIDTKKSKKVS